MGSSHDKYTHHGFTLLEVLVSIALTSIILGAIYHTFFLSNRAVLETDETVLKLEEARKGLDLIHRELESLYFDKKSKTANQLEIVDRDVYGRQASGITFCTLCTPGPGISRLSYRVAERNNKLVLLKDVLPAYGEGRERLSGRPGVFLENLESFLIEVPYKEGWTRTWDASVSGRPSRIKVTIAVPLGKRPVILSTIAQLRIRDI
ncbi:MAG: prepilin-type N-terminal cleavage/methylation domain-containing protein [Pseudomonadota bacterium]